MSHRQANLELRTETTLAANNQRPALKHAFKKNGTRQTVTGTRGKQNGAGNTATQVKTRRYKTHNS
jgi:hypothetical protein